MPRTILIGDVHGMLRELDALLDAVGPTSGDRLISIGDLIHKGPDSVGVVRRARELDMELILGNHENQQARFRTTLSALRLRFPSKPDIELVSRIKMAKAPALYELERRFSAEDMAFLESAQLWAAVPGGIAVHAGIAPVLKDLPTPEEVAAASPRDRSRIELLCRTRFVRGRREVELTAQFPIKPDAEPEPDREDRLSSPELETLLDPDGEATVIKKVVREQGAPLTLGKEGPDDPFWADVYDGRFGTTYFGHQPYTEAADPVEFPHAVGLDLGAVFGNRLAAAVVESDGSRRYVTVRSSGRFARSLWEE